MAKHRLLLTYPNQNWFKPVDVATSHKLPPTTLCLLAAMVEELVEVKIVDCHFHDLSREAFRAEVAAFQPHFVGISMLTTEYAGALDVAAELVKGVDPGIVTIAGGVHVTTRYEQVMRNPAIDYACRGEGEYLLVELLRHLMGAGPLPTEGLVYRDAGGKLVAQAQRFVPDLTRLPRPAYHLVDLAPYLNRDSRYGPTRFPVLPGITMVTTRGCPYGCTFCEIEAISGRKIRSRDPVAVVDELSWLKERYGLRSVVFMDDNLFALRNSAKALLREMIRRNLGLKWMSSAFAIFRMDDEMLDLMVQSGCVGVNVAIESGSPRVLKEIIHKPIRDLDAVPGLIGRIKDKGLFVLSNFIIGLPGESWEEIRQTIRFAEICGADYVKIFVAVPLKGTRLYDMAVAMGALDVGEGEVQVDWRHSQLRSPEWTPQDVSVLRVYEWDRINFSPERIGRVAEIWGMSVAELSQVRKATRDTLTLGGMER